MLFTSMPFGNLLLIIMHVRVRIDDPCECMHVLIIAVYFGVCGVKRNGDLLGGAGIVKRCESRGSFD